MINLPTYEQFINESSYKSLWRNTSWKWLYDLLKNEKIIAKGKKYISLSLDFNSGNMDDFGKTKIEFDYYKIIDQGGEEVWYEPEYFEQEPDIAMYVTGFSSAKEYYNNKGYEGPEDANANNELTWDEYVVSFDNEQEVVIKQIKYQNGLIKNVEFNEKPDKKLIDLLDKYNIKYI